MKNKIITRYITGILILSGIFFLFVTGCEKDDPPPSEEIMARDHFYELMNEWYLWYDKMPDVLLEAMRYLPKDVYSYIMSKQEFDLRMIEGKYIGHGFSWGFDDNGIVRIIFVFKDSPLYDEGVRRGWIINKVNGTAITIENRSTIFGDKTVGYENTIEFITAADSTVSITTAKKEIQKNSVLYYDTLHVNGTVTAHMVFQEFMQPSIEEFTEVFSFFNSTEATEMILDLRYNPGGFMNVSTLLASLITGENTNDKIFTKNIYNDKKSDENSSALFEEQTNSLNLNKVIILTTGATASASEALINGLKPHIDVVTIGDVTYGKPVGMRVFVYENYVFLPITFRIANSNNESDYYDGIQPDAFCDDDFTRAFDNREEACLKEAIYYLENGSFSGTKGRKVKAYEEKVSYIELLEKMAI
jgi:C-terminal processing protease CtpA/Prc